MEIVEERLNEINLKRVRNKGENLSSHEHDKDRTVQHTKRKVTLPNIVSPAKKNTSDTEFSDDTSSIEKEKAVNDRKDDKNKKYNEDKDSVFPDDISSVEMEKDIIKKKNESKKIYDEGKEDECPNDTPPAQIEECVGDRND